MTRGEARRKAAYHDEISFENRKNDRIQYYKRPVHYSLFVDGLRQDVIRELYKCGKGAFAL